MNHLKRHLSVANVLSCLALFMALSGVAYAATLGKNAVKAKNIANGAVTSPKLKNGSVTAAKLGNSAVISTKLGNGSVIAEKIANGAVRSAALGGGVVTSGKLKDGAVTGSKLANDAVTNSKLGPDAVNTAKLQNGAVTSAKLSSGFLGQLVRNVTYANKESGAVSATSPQTATAECPVGKQAIGGGIRVIPGDALIVQTTESIPFVAGDGKRTGWTASAKTEEGGKTFAVEAYAVCAEL